MEGLTRQDELKAASSEGPEPRAHMRSLWVALLDQWNVMTACSHTDDAPDTDQYPPFEDVDC